MGIQKFQISFDNSYGTYYEGQTVSGQVELVLDAPKKVRAIKIQFKGIAETSWSETRREHGSDGKSRTHTVFYSGEEDYFDARYNLVDGGSTSLVLPAGSEVYKFSYTLPQSLPSSFEGKHGYTRYTVKVTLDRPWKFDHETKAALTVISHVDLNMMPLARRQGTINVDKYFCCCWCQSGPLKIIAAIPCTGYVPGQDVPITMELENTTNVEVTSVGVALVKTVTFHSTNSTYGYSSSKKMSEDIILQSNFSGVGCRSSDIRRHQLRIPALPPSNLRNCSIIDLDYRLQFTVHLSGIHQKIIKYISLIIGTVPFANLPTVNMQGNVPNASAPPIFTAPGAPGAPEMSPEHKNSTAPGWNLPSDIPPPSYEQCTFGTKSIQDSSDTKYTMYSGNNPNFSPMYPVYPSSST